MPGAQLGKLVPVTGNWNLASNWTPASVPNSSADTATFATSSITAISLSADVQVDSTVFNSGASSFTISSTSVTFTLSGGGATNNSGKVENFVAGVTGSGARGVFRFTNNATAGTGTVFTASGPIVAGALSGLIQFEGTSTAGNANFVNNGSTAKAAVGGIVQFINTSSAGSAILTNNGGTINGAGGGIVFFVETSTAGNATLTANAGRGAPGGGSIRFLEDSTGGTARINVLGNGNMDVSQRNPPGLTTGSIEGNGAVFLGAVNLTVGANNLSTTFMGVLQDGGASEESGGSLTKIGTGTLTLSNANTYTGGTTVEDGALLVKSKQGSATGTGAIFINGGMFGGTGAVAGAVNIGGENGSAASFSPGVKPTVPGALTIQSALTFNSGATCSVVLDDSKATADKVVANGTTIKSGAQFSLVAVGHGTLSIGTVFEIIDNTAATAITGRFANLADGSTLISDGNSFLVDYEGGDGNDLTLKVVSPTFAF